MTSGSEPATSESSSRTHILTVMLEDFFQGGAFANVIDRRRWSRFDPRFEQNSIRALDLLDKHKAKATFFTMGWLAEKCPEILQEVTARGHEVASSGYAKKSFRHVTPSEFREDLLRSRDLIEKASGSKVLGFRVADRLLAAKDLWALEVLAEQGYVYDSSLSPSLRSFGAEPWRRVPHKLQFGDRSIWEFPLPTVTALGLSIPIAGGNYLRQLPQFLVKPALDHWLRTHNHPYILYFRVWDLDVDQPVITGAPLAARLRHYRHAQQMPELLDRLLSRSKYTSFAEHLRLNSTRSDTNSPGTREYVRNNAVTLNRATTLAIERVAVTIVVPCFNEELVLSYLSRTLREFEEEMADRYRLHYVFVDDGSTDSTWHELQRLRAQFPNTTLLRHDANRGVAAAIMSGIRSAQTDIVCSIDCDCTYDPKQLGAMIPLLDEAVDVVTASPYHPQGRVLNVPRWRLVLSKSASFLYRAVLGQSLHTYTSCFRVYRRQASIEMEITEPGFLGIAELIGMMAIRGARLVEHPAVLEVRVLGHSKMKILGTICGHMRLLTRFAGQRLIRMFKRNGKKMQLSKYRDWNDESETTRT